MAKSKQPHLGDVIRGLREARGLSQTDLADAASLSVDPIRRVEQASKTGKKVPGFRPATLIQLMGGLQQAMPLTIEEFNALFDAAGTSQAVRPGVIRNVSTSAHTSSSSDSSAIASPDADLDDLYERLKALLGRQRLRGILEGIATANNISITVAEFDSPAAASVTSAQGTDGGKLKRPTPG